MKVEKLELKLAIKANKERQSCSNTIWEKMVKDSYSISCYNPNSYLIFTKKLKEKKLIIPINQDNPYKLEIVLLNIIYSYTHFSNLIYN